MEIKFSPSVNIIRDSGKELNYLSTPNAKRGASQIAKDFRKGFHSFCLIGSYGTGKSSFLWAFEESLSGKENYFDISTLRSNKVIIIKLVGDYQSIINAFAEQFNVKNKTAGNQEIFDAIFQEYEKIGKQKGLLVIEIDEMGKFLEFAANNNPERELYFIQQLAEFVNDKDRNILFISTLHQSFEAYSNALTDSQRKEWIKIKGRLKELPFNEPVEQLLLLASSYIKSQFPQKPLKINNEELIKLNEDADIFPIPSEFAKKVVRDIYPLDIFSANVLTLALQQYGQNERSLFTFLESSDDFGISNWKPGKSIYFNLADVYNYLIYNYYSFLNTAYNPHYSQWSSIKGAIERAESIIETDLPDTLQILKTIGLLNCFASKGAKIDDTFLIKYCTFCLGIDDATPILKELSAHKIIRFNKYNGCYKLFEGTDLDINAALKDIGNKVDDVTDVVTLLAHHFERTYITAKQVSYIKGTPRNFEVIVSEEPIVLAPKDAIDGYVNIIFKDGLTEKQLVEISENTEEAILYGYFSNTTQIRELLMGIEKAEKVLKQNHDDIVARRELKTIIAHQKNLLNHYLLNDLYKADKTVWAYNGVQEDIGNKKQLNQLLTRICDEIYTGTPEYRNELVNKHKISSSIHTARKNYMDALVNRWNIVNLGFNDGEFPPEKTIYISLLKETGIHDKADRSYELRKPKNSSSFNPVWQECENFLYGTRNEKKKISELIGAISLRPFKLKQGLIDFWVPTFLFIKRGDYALYEDGKFIPYINESILYLITRNPEKYEVKAFEIAGIRLKLFNKYRDYLKQDKKAKLTNEAFIESIRPFLTFYKELPQYSKTTLRLSNEAKELRKAIINAQDPEKVFFEDFPTALKLTLNELADSDAALAGFAQTLNSSIEEIKNVYNELLNGIERFIQDEIIGERVEFSSYRKLLQKRFQSIKDHQLLPRQRIFIQRLNSPLNDRDSWIGSIAQAILQKPLDQINDEDEYKLKDKLQHFVTELDNLREISKERRSGNEVLKLDLTTLHGGMRSRIVEIPKGKSGEVEKLSQKIRQHLKLKETVSLVALITLLNEFLKDEQD